MAFDLDNDELRATREIHKTSNKNVALKNKIMKKINYCELRIKHAKLINDKEQEDFYYDLKRHFLKLLE